MAFTAALACKLGITYPSKDKPQIFLPRSKIKLKKFSSTVYHLCVESKKIKQTSKYNKK